ncbi:MAG TPA: xanthine dehydrogenase family protein subunit M [Vicinamibacterales bacterium]|nr:xanthine dehydrogenase family protein subunit M [Vicinamibacterales bacterium]
MKAFAYVDAANEKEAVAALGTERGRILPLAGGMDLLALMKDYVAQPERLVNVKNLDATIRRAPGGGLRIGSAVTVAELAEHPDVSKLYPALAQAALEVGSPQIRNLGTVGGNMAQRPRCWYFRNEEFHCLKKGGSRCFAVDGENQYHAIFGGGPCHIVHPSSLALPAIALDARFRVVGPAGEREVPAGEFFLMPDRNLFGETVLAPNELLTHVILPPPGGIRSATYEVRFKQSHDWPLAAASVALTLSGKTIKAARVVMGAVAPIPWRSQAAEAALAGKPLSEETAMAAADAAVTGAKPMSGNAYKVQIARTAVKRAILKAGGLRTV